MTHLWKAGLQTPPAVEGSVIFLSVGLFFRFTIKKQNKRITLDNPPKENKMKKSSAKSHTDSANHGFNIQYVFLTNRSSRKMGNEHQERLHKGPTRKGKSLPRNTVNLSSSGRSKDDSPHS